MGSEVSWFLRSFNITIIGLFFFLGLTNCGERIKDREFRLNGSAQGTTYHIKYLAKEKKALSKPIDSLLRAVDNSLSTYQKESLISKVNQEDSLVVDELFVDVLSKSMEVYTKTEGAFDPTVAPIVNAWGFGFEDRSNVDGVLIYELLHFVDFNNVELNYKNKLLKKKNGVKLDFNAIAQGYSVDLISLFLESIGIENYMVELGGEVKARGKNINHQPWRLGIDKPIPGLKSRELVAIVNLQDKSMATSGNYRKFYEKDGVKYSHTIDPSTGYPVQHSLLSATVVTDECAMADAYATAFMVMGLEKSKELLKTNNNLEGIFIYSDQKGNLKSFISKGIGDVVELKVVNE